MTNENEKDAFWDLASLMPARRKSRPSRPFSPTAQEIEREVPPPSPSGNITTYPQPRSEEERTLFTPIGQGEQIDMPTGGNPLILRVTLSKKSAQYSFYGQFRRDAERYFSTEGKPCPPVSFFSYIPQYSQLNAAQKNWYFYWRTMARRGEFLPCDECYFYLYVYEIINLPELIPPKDGILQLVQAWSAVRAKHPRIDKYMVEWVADYCLMHGLACPMEEILPFLPAILPLASIKEFYLGSLGNFTPRGVETALAFFSDYRYRESRFANGEHALLFARHLRGAMTPVLSRLFEENRLTAAGDARTRKSHEAFCGSLCAHNIKCRIEVEYLALTDASFLRGTVTAAVKYAENRLRAALSVKSRLTVPPLDPAVRLQIDEYFATVREEICPRKETPVPAYEHLYDAPTRGIDPAAARAIEAASWDTTRILVAEEEEEAAPSPQMPAAPLTAERPDPVPPPTEALAAEGEYPCGLTVREIAYLDALLRSDRADLRALLAGGELEEELAASVNEKTAAHYGDIVVEPCEQGFCVISDYREDVITWINQMK